MTVSSQTGIVTNWSATGPAKPYAIVGISLVCFALLSLYTFSSPLLQQALIDVLGMQPQAVAQLIHSHSQSWWNYPAITALTAIFLWRLQEPLNWGKGSLILLSI